MDANAIQAALDDVFDQAILYHAYTDYMRDYEVITFAVAAPSTGIAPAYERYLFRDCVEATVTTVLTPDTWRRSLDDRLLDREPPAEVDGYVWGVRWQELYPGGTVVQDSKRARRWTRKLGVPFHEIRIGANCHTITLVFSDLSVEPVALGYRPFMVLDERHGVLAPVLDLVVLRSTDPSATRAFYEALGLVFTEEQHAGGPRHLAAILGNGAVLEIYPAASTSAAGSGPRLGFVVADVQTALDALAAVGTTVPAGQGVPSSSLTRTGGRSTSPRADCQRRRRRGSATKRRR